MQDKYQKKQTERINQKIKILINRPDFQQKVLDLRKKWKIPSAGIKSELENQNWQQQLDIDTDKYYEENWPKERKEIIELRKRGKFQEAEEKRKETYSQAPLSVFNNDVWIIIRAYRLSPRWHAGISHYLLFNDSKNMNIPAGVTVSYHWENGIMQISLEIDRDTTLEDLKRVWSWARKIYRDRRTLKFQPIKNFERDKRAYELEKEGKKPIEIENIIEKEFGEILSYNEISTAIKRYKKRLNIN